MNYLRLEYPTHILLLSSNKGYTKVKNTVLGEAYSNMVDAILSDFDKAINFVQHERILLNNFLKSLLDFHNKTEYLFAKPFTYFNDEYEYYVFCIINDIEFKEQEWFNIAFIEEDIYTTYAYLKNASIKLLQMLYPEYATISTNLLEEWFRSWEDEAKKYKCNPDDYKHFLEENEIDCLYHFSSSANTDSIKDRGLCSIMYLKEQKIDVDYVSNEASQLVDKRKGMEDYVHLGYEAKHPMLMKALAKGTLSSYKVYHINPIVLFLKKTKYTRCNAIKRNAEISDDINFFLQIPFKRFHKRSYFDLTEEEKDLFQSEVLVHRNIPNSLIKL